MAERRNGCTTSPRAGEGSLQEPGKPGAVSTRESLHIYPYLPMRDLRKRATTTDLIASRKKLFLSQGFHLCRKTVLAAFSSCRAGLRLPVRIERFAKVRGGLARLRSFIFAAKNECEQLSKCVCDNLANVTTARAQQSTKKRSSLFD